MKRWTPAMISMLIAATAVAVEQPNVIVILTDDQGYGDMSCHGNPYLKTPELDRLYAEGVRLADLCQPLEPIR